MAQQTINVGAAPNDGTGTPLRTAFQYTNSNFSELYTAVGPSGNNIVVPGTATITGDLTVDTSTLKVDSANNRVGILTASPTHTLDVRGIIKSNGTYTAYVNPNFTGAAAIQTESAESLILAPSGQESLRCAPSGVYTFGDGAGGTRMTLNSTGLGVGASPASGIKLNVHQGGSTSAYLKISNGDTGSGTGDGLDIIVNNAAGNYKTNFLLRETGAMAFWTDSTERLLIDATGNVGIGVTPSAWASTLKAIQVTPSSYSSLAGGYIGATPLSIIAHNATFDGTNWIRINAHYASLYRQSDGTHRWELGGTGAAGSTFTPTQAMTLDASGTLLVGKSAASLANVGLRVDNTGETFLSLNSNSNTTQTHFVYSIPDAAYKFYVGLAGTVFATNTTISAISDARLKENVQDIDVGLGAILALKPRKFDWKEGKGKNIKGDRGFIAQEFEQVFPQLVDEWKDAAPEGEAPYKSVRQDLIPVLVKAIQELAARVQTIETR